MPSGVFSLKQQAQARSEGAWPGSPPTTLNYLVVAGGGGGGKSNAANSGAANGGGGGAGGLLQGVIAVIPGNSYTVTVGAGGTGGGGSDGIGADGANSVFGSITSTGGGGGGNSAASGANAGRSGGSGGGAGGGGTSLSTGGTGTSGQGNAGGGNTYASSGYGTGGGGGAGTIGLTGTSSVGGNGGAGIASDISGVRVVYAGGGGGSTYNGNGTAGSGGVGGGGAGTINGSTAGGAGGGNTGGGGGGGSFTSPSTVSNGGNGGSGIVIVSYPGTTQWFTGGTLSYANGNVIHTFYSSGTLAPTAPSNFVNTDYQISRSLRFNSADSAYLNRTPGSASNRKTFTWSGWVKRSSLDLASTKAFFNCGATSTTTGFVALIYSDNTITSIVKNSASTAEFISSAVWRDVSAWYHVVIAIDTTQATASNRLKVYVNNTQLTWSTSGTIDQNLDTEINNTTAFEIGAYKNSSGTRGSYFDGYMTEINFIDGQALTPSAFGYVNPNTGVWSPLKFVGTYGTNGFYLNFSDNSNTTAATLGKDYSGNGNNWTPNNFSVTAGAGNDSLVDSPTAYGTDTGAGGEVRGNYATLNPLENPGGATIPISNGNLYVSFGNAMSANTIVGTTAVSSGKWYWEITPTGTVAYMIGVADANAVSNSVKGWSGGAFGWYYYDYGQKYTNNTPTTYGAIYTSGDVIGVALDMDAGTLTFYKNGVSQGVAYSVFSGKTIQPALGTATGGSGVAYNCNFGQRPFAYTAPSGFKALVNQNLPTPTIGATSTTQADNHFGVLLYTGTGDTQTVTSADIQFTPDFMWFKRRNGVVDHYLYDTIRGWNKSLSSNTTGAEGTTGDKTPVYGGALLNETFSGTNAVNGTFVAWSWKANGAGVTNTAGTITSTVSANTTAGFSIVTYTGNATAGATVGHGLGVAPSMIIIKGRSTAYDWIIYHASIGNTKFLDFTTAAENTNIVAWNNTSPTSTVFTLGTAARSNENNATQVAYCFAPVAGYSAFGSYTGNGSTDGPFVYTGFRPAFILVKCSSTGSTNWFLWDNKINSYNVASTVLLPNSSGAELGSRNIDILSNGFKCRANDSNFNGSGDTYIYAAFSENPFKYALAR